MKLEIYDLLTKLEEVKHLLATKNVKATRIKMTRAQYDHLVIEAKREGILTNTTHGPTIYDLTIEVVDDPSD